MNPRPFACEANVITTTLPELRGQNAQFCIIFMNHIISPRLYWRCNISTPRVLEYRMYSYSSILVVLSVQVVLSTVEYSTRTVRVPVRTGTSIIRPWPYSRLLLYSSTRTCTQYGGGILVQNNVLYVRT